MYSGSDNEINPKHNVQVLIWPWNALFFSICPSPHPSYTLNCLSHRWLLQRKLVLLTEALTRCVMDIWSFYLAVIVSSKLTCGLRGVAQVRGVSTAVEVQKTRWEAFKLYPQIPITQVSTEWKEKDNILGMSLDPLNIFKSQIENYWNLSLKCKCGLSRKPW